MLLEDPMVGRLTRRAFLAGSTLAVGGVAIADRAGRKSTDAARGVIEIRLIGGPSAQETFDPKPLATSRERGPFSPIATRVPGIQLSECFPQLARRMDRFAIVRTLHHHEAPIHETGLQLLATGRAFGPNEILPHWAARAAQVLGGDKVPVRGSGGSLISAPFWVQLPGPLGDTGVGLPQGLAGATLVNQESWPRIESAEMHHHVLSSSLQAAVDWLKRGTRVVTVLMYPSVWDRVTWDVHAASHRLPTHFTGYRDAVCPAFDQAFASLLDRLRDEGLWEATLVVAAGEMGRTPRLNRHGGRDHWTGAWSALLAGGRIQGGRTVGQTDSAGAYPTDRPVTPAELIATMVDHLGGDLEMMDHESQGMPASGPFQAIQELF